MEKPNTKLYKINTTQFGEIEFEEKYIFHFQEGLLGFEDLKKFLLISDEETEPFKWLISIEKPEIGFPLLNPWIIDLNYSLNQHYNIDNEAVLVVITLGGNQGLISANLKAPIILNIPEQTGRQIILPSEKYSTTHIIQPKKKD